MTPQAVFVCGATGTQGGALARELLSQGIAVHAVARKPDSPPALALASLGAKLWPGDFDDEDALRDALQGTDAVFLNFMPDFADVGANLRQARLITRLAAAAGATHGVCSSGLDAEFLGGCLDGVPEDSFFSRCMRHKLDIEDEVRRGFATHAVLRPGYFMANLVQPFVAMYPGLASTGRWSSALRPDTVLPLTDTATLGVFAAAAVLDPGRFHGEDLYFADEMLTVGEIARRLEAATGRDIRVEPMPEDDVQAQKDANPFIRGQLITRTLERAVDMDRVRSYGLPLSTFDAYLEREKGAVEATYASVPRIE